MSSASELRERVESPHLILMSALIAMNAGGIVYGYYRGTVEREWLLLALIFFGVSVWVLGLSMPQEFGR